MIHALAALVVLSLLPSQTSPVREDTDWYYDGPDGSAARVEAAAKAKSEVVRKLFADVGVDFPPGQILLRVYKTEKELEVWASSATTGPLTHVATWRVCYSSGSVGPKRRQGDYQVPEGFYKLDMFNSHSQFYLSMRINYPNESDRILSNKSNPGSAIMIHGSCVSIGCLAMSDERIQELWLITKAAHDAKRTVLVHLFPARDMEALIADQPSVDLKAFWGNIKEGRDLFEKDHVLPAISVIKKGDKAGLYSFKVRQQP